MRFRDMHRRLAKLEGTNDPRGLVGVPMEQGKAQALLKRPEAKGLKIVVSPRCITLTLRHGTGYVELADKSSSLPSVGAVARVVAEERRAFMKRHGGKDAGQVAAEQAAEADRVNRGPGAP